MFNRRPMNIGVQYYSNVERPDGSAAHQLRFVIAPLIQPGPTEKERENMMFARLGHGLVVASLLSVLLPATPALAQLNTQHLKGTAGLKAGSQPPPGGYVIAPILYFYSTDTIKDRDGNEFPNRLDATLNISLFGAGYSHVTTKKILGGNYGFQVLFPLGANNRIQGTEIDANPGAGLTDSAIQPIGLGWHFKRVSAATS